MMSLLSRGLVVGGLAVAAATAVAIAALGPDRPTGLTYTVPEEVDPGAVVAGTSYDLTFEIANRSDRTVQVVGLRTCCSDNCRFRVDLSPPTDVPPFGRLAVSYRVQPNSPGPFDGQIFLFVSDAVATREHRVHLAGTASP